jgi:RNA polymerase-associated protein
MAISAARRPVIRIVLAEKGITADIIDVDVNNPPEDLIDINAYNSVPTLVDRDLVLYDSMIIMEYLDERFPHPPLMPVDPVSRARTRMMLYRIDKDWYGLIGDLTGDDATRAERAREVLRSDFAMLSPLLAKKPFFMSDEFALIECAIAPILWRLPLYGLEIPSQLKPLLRYAERIFSRPSFRASLSTAEQELVR